jgi:uncharacterized protein DUF3606
LHAVDPQPGNAAMQRVKHPPIRNKISLADPTQVRAWTRRLAISADSLKAVIDKVGNSVAAVTKEVESQRAVHSTSPAPPIESPLDGQAGTKLHETRRALARKWNGTDRFR